MPETHLQERKRQVAGFYLWQLSGVRREFQYCAASVIASSSPPFLKGFSLAGSVEEDVERALRPKELFPVRIL